MNAKTTINSANNFAQNYDDYIQNCQWIGTDILFGLMYQYIKLNQTILDIGIGTGLSSILFKQFGLTIYGIDGAMEMIKVCQDKKLAKGLRQIDLTKDHVWFENKTFDHTVSHGVFHLIGDLKNIFKQTSLILDKNGCFGFTYEGMQDSEDDYKESSIVGLFERQNLQSGIKVFRHTDKYIFELMEANGFQLLKKTEFLAFVDSITKAKTYFNVIIAKKGIKMTQLYSTLANIYHEMYQHVFDYDKEFRFYDSLLKSNNSHNILEIGCGSGMLARRFLNHGYKYLGLDLFNEMLDIARSEIKSDKFIQGDMRNLSFNQQFDSVLITGRSIAYVIENKGIVDTFTGIHKSLKDKGLFVFGVFEANGIFDNFSDFEQIIEHNDKKIRRISKLKKNLETGWTYDWFAKYIIEEDGKVSEFDDLTTLRAFTKDEILLFLKLTNFKIIEIIEEEKTFTLITEKI